MSRTPRRFIAAVALTAAVAACFAPTTRAATIVADFEGAAGTVDHFPGVAGSGWGGPWAMVNGTGVSYAGAVANSAPLDASPNYLSVSRSGGTAAGTAHVRRPFNTFGDVDPTQPHRITVKLRFDGNLTDFNGSFQDRLNLFADPGAVTTTAPSNSWMIGAAGGSNGTSNVVPAPNTFFFFDAGNEPTANAFTGANLVNTGVALNPGTVYSFTIDVYPGLGKYDATINDGTNSFTGTDLQFRNGLASASAANAPDTLYFGIQSSAAADNHAYSVDALTITAIPEPATFGLFAVGALALATRRRR